MSGLLSILSTYIPPPLLRRLLAYPTPRQEPDIERFQAAVLFADISGFTALTEQFASREGDVQGPEELIHVLNPTFSQIISLLEEEGGEVVKFSGDALTAVFPSHDEPLSYAIRRGWQAGQAIQSAITDAPHSPLLAVKIGIGVGEVMALQVGGVFDRWEYLVAGEPIRQASQAENEGRAGEVRLSSQAEQQIHPRPLPPRAIVYPDPSPLAENDSFIDLLRLYVPGAVRQWLDKDLRQWLAVLRPMSVLFMGISGLDYDQPHILEQIHQFMRQVQETLYKYEGSINKLVMDDKGTSCLALLGLPPFAHVDDPVRAVHCALSWQKLAQEHGLQIKLGVATGHVFAGPVGSDRRREYTVIGDAVNLAARLMKQADKGEILCDFHTYHQARGRLAFEALPPIRVKGKAGLVRVYRPREDAPPAPAARTTPLVGRQQELDRLQQAIETIKRDRQSQLLIVEGEAGIGKSRLIGELVRLLREQGIVEVIGAGHSIEQHTPYRAWHDILQAYFGLRDFDSNKKRRLKIEQFVQILFPEQLPRLPLLNDVIDLNFPETTLTAALDASLRRQNLEQFVLALLHTWASEDPFVLIVEDAHWLDSLSWQLVAYVARGIATLNIPLLLIIVTRPFDEITIEKNPLPDLRKMAVADTLKLTTLPPDETIALIKQRLNLAPDGLPAAVDQLIRERAGGNPFFAEELVFTLHDQKVIAFEPHADHPSQMQCVIKQALAPIQQTLPDTIQGLILARIDRLAPERQLVLKIGAVIGRTFAYPPLRHVVQKHMAISESLLRDHLSALAVLDLTPLETTEPVLTYIFKHIITQEVAYQTLLFAQRRELHQTVAEWYEQVYFQNGGAPDDSQAAFILPLLAHHYHQAENEEKELHYAYQAAEQTVARYAIREALHFLDRALTLTPPTGTWRYYQLLLMRERVYNWQGDRSAQAQDLAALAALASDLPWAEAAEIALRQARFADLTGDYPAAIKHAQTAVQNAQKAGSIIHEAAAHACWGRSVWHQSGREKAHQQLQKALDLIHTTQETAVLSDPDLHHRLRKVEAEIYRSLGGVYLHRNEYETSRQHYQQSLDICEQIGDLVGHCASLNNLGAVAFFEGDYVTSRSQFEETLQAYRKIGNRRGQGIVSGNLGEIAARSGDYGRARTYIERSLQIYQETGYPAGEGSAHDNLGELALRYGDYPQAQEHFTQALVIFRTVGDRQGEANMLGQLALVLHYLEQNEQAYTYVQQAHALHVRLRDRKQQGTTLLYQGHIMMASGQPEMAVAAYSSACRLYDEIGETRLAMGGYAALALAQIRQKEIPAAQQAVEKVLDYLAAHVLESLEDPFRVYLACYQVLAASQDERAQEVLKTAVLQLQERAAKISDIPTRQIFLQNIPHHQSLLQAWQAAK